MDKGYYLGIDLDDKNAIISFYTTEKSEPETVSPVAGSEIFQIPLLLAKRHGIGQWFIGEDAKKAADRQESELVEGLLKKAINRETVSIEEETYSAEELLALFLKKLILMPGRLGNPRNPDKLVIALKELSERSTELMFDLAEVLGLEKKQIMLVDRKESFYYFAYSQPEELWLHDVCLFDCRGEKVDCIRVERNQKTSPQVVTLTETERVLDAANKDGSFLKILEETFRGHIISSVYLLGDGFDENWMKASLSFMCKGRRAFIGKNLYSKGACYAARARAQSRDWPFIYMGENELKMNVSLKVKNRGREEFYSLLDAGMNWYEAQGECEIILADDSEIDFWLKLPGSREAKVEKINLVDIPKRPARTTRLRIHVRPVSDEAVKLQIKDMGFGEFFKSSQKSWEYVMSMNGGV